MLEAVGELQKHRAFGHPGTLGDAVPCPDGTDEKEVLKLG